MCHFRIYMFKSHRSQRMRCFAFGCFSFATCCSLSGFDDSSPFLMLVVNFWDSLLSCYIFSWTPTSWWALLVFPLPRRVFCDNQNHWCSSFFREIFTLRVCFKSCERCQINYLFIFNSFQLFIIIISFILTVTAVLFITHSSRFRSRPSASNECVVLTQMKSVNSLVRLYYYWYKSTWTCSK